MILRQGSSERTENVLIVVRKCRLCEMGPIERVSKADRQFCRFQSCCDGRANILYYVPMLESLSMLLSKSKMFFLQWKGTKCRSDGNQIKRALGLDATAHFGVSTSLALRVVPNVMLTPT